MPLVVYAQGREALRRRSVPFIAWGAAIVVFGVAVLIWPRLTGTLLITLLGTALFASGVVLLFGALRLRPTRWWWLPIVPALPLLAFGAWTLLSPESIATFFLTVAAILVILSGLGDVAVAATWRRSFGGWYVRLLRGLVLVAAGVWVLVTPLSGLVALGWLLGTLAIGVGALSVWLGVLVRRA